MKVKANEGLVLKYVLILKSKLTDGALLFVGSNSTRLTKNVKTCALPLTQMRNTLRTFSYKIALYIIWGQNDIYCIQKPIPRRLSCSFFGGGVEQTRATADEVTNWCSEWVKQAVKHSVMFILSTEFSVIFQKVHDQRESAVPFFSKRI